MHPVTLALCHHHAYLAQVFQVMRDLWLVCLKNFSEVTDADLAPVQQIEKSKPRAIGQCCTQSRNVLRFNDPLHEGRPYQKLSDK